MTGECLPVPPRPVPYLCRKLEQNTKKTRRKLEGSKVGDSDAAATVAHAAAPVGAQCVYWCNGAPSALCCGGAEESKGGNGEEEEDCDAAAAFPYAVAPVGAPSVYCCGG
jgi:hypothetical protein